MRIDSTTVGQTILGLIQPNASRDNAKTSDTTPVPEAASSFDPTGDLLGLLDNLRQLPPVREEVVGEVAQRLASNELLTPEARDQTVGSILETALPEG
jgi:hypothetical protein